MAGFGAARGRPDPDCPEEISCGLRDPHRATIARRLPDSPEKSRVLTKNEVAILVPLILRRRTIWHVSHVRIPNRHRPPYSTSPTPPHHKPLPATTSALPRLLKKQSLPAFTQSVSPSLHIPGLPAAFPEPPRVSETRAALSNRLDEDVSERHVKLEQKGSTWLPKLR